MLLTVGLLAAPEAEPALDGWTLIRALRFADAYQTFKEGESSDLREVFGEAIALLNAPPKTRPRLAEAQRLLEMVAKSPDPELQVLARYYLARIAQVHAYEPDWPTARRLFASLLADFPQHSLAQLGAAKLALLDMYDAEPTEPVAERFARLAELGKGLTDPAAKRDFHYVMGCAAIYHKLPDELALAHLIASRDAVLTNDVNRANVFIRIGETAHAMGLTDLARDHFTRFLAVAPLDVRARHVRDRLTELGGPLEEQP